VSGIARDLAAAGIGQATHNADRYDVIEGGFPCPVPIRIEEGSGCRVFWGREIRGVRNGPSPEWLQRRLKAVGLRPISALVDITNFFTIDRARPLHVYDVAKLEGGITVRRGRSGDRFLALNDKEYEATRDDCVIADESGAIGFGGVIGGESTGVDENTTDVLLECAWFEPEAVAASGRRHGINSDARARFERGVDPASLSSGIESAAAMIIELCGGEASEPRIATDHVDDSFFTLPMKPYRPSRLKSLAGIDLDPDAQRSTLVRLGFVDMDLSDPERWQVRPPSWRPDIDGEADLVEEIARITGYDQVPSTPLPRVPGVAKATATRSQLVERRMRRTAASRGLDEAVTWSFISDAEAAALGGGEWIIANPISEDMKVMRPSLLPGLIAAARRNLDRGASSVRLFEIGRRYGADAEHPTLAFILAGERASRGWQTGKAQGFDAFDAKAEVVALLDAAGVPVDNLQVFPDAGPTWHPGRSATLRLGPKTIVASFGELHPGLQKSLDGPAGAVAAELYLDAIPQGRTGSRARPAYAPPALQAVTRDFAFIVPADVPSEALARAIRGADKAAITDVRLFDRFEAPEGLSLAFEVTLQPAEKSFTDEQIAEISRRIVAAGEKLGARLRT
jgi:phenylalanyl-tRNA synthetase beta chain